MTRTRCGKRCFTSASQARRAHRYARFSLHTYFCDGCHAYHVANRDKR